MALVGLVSRGSNGAGPAPTVGTATNISGSSTTSKNAQMPGSAPVPAGVLLVATFCWGGVAGSDVSSVTDTDGNTWTVHSTTHRDNAGTSVGCAIATCRPIATIPASSAGWTFTATLAVAVTNFNAQFMWWPSNLTDAENGIAALTTNNGNSTNPIGVATNTANVAGTRSHAAAVYCWATNTAATSGASFTERFDGRISTTVFRYYVQTRSDLAPATSVTPTTTMGTGADWCVTGLTFALANDKPQMPSGARGRQAVIGARY